MIDWMLTTHLLFMEVSAGILVMILISSYGWLGLAVESILISNKKIMLVNMDTELITICYPPWRTHLCTDCHTIEHGKSTQQWASQKDTTLTEMLIQVTKTTNFIISLRPSPAINGLWEFTNETKETTEKPLNYWSKVNINNIWKLKNCQKLYWKLILTPIKQKYEKMMLKCYAKYHSLSILS